MLLGSDSIHPDPDFHGARCCLLIGCCSWSTRQEQHNASMPSSTRRSRSELGGVHVIFRTCPEQGEVMKGAPS